LPRTTARSGFEGLGVTVIRETGRFVDAEMVEAGETRIKARRFVIATGSSPATPPIPGLDKVDYFTNETLFDNKTLPTHLIVIGGGPIGMEMAQAHRRLGAKVTVLEAFQPLGKDDPELTSIVLDHLRGEGIDIRAGVKITDISQSAKGITIAVDDDGKAESIAGSHLLVALAASPIQTASTLTLPASGMTSVASRSMTACAPPTARSMPSAMWLAACSSPTWPATRPDWWSAQSCSGCR
jgi:pyruvate/2-oxoglutarate dehydrogenase complex dihydrolipoamide dehydrogenase (E3) component